jgi:hypothetical protein
VNLPYLGRITTVGYTCGVPDRSIPPSTRRRRDAHLAGHRPRGRWLEAGAIGLVGLAVLEASGSRIEALFASFWSGGVEPEQIVWIGGTGLAFLLVGAGVLAGLLGVLQGRFGPRHAGALAESAELGRTPASPGLGITLALALTLVAVVGVALFGTVAAAARGVDASELGTRALWWGQCHRVVVVAGVACLVIGLIEWVASQQRLWSALHLDRETAKRERRRAGIR